MRKANRFIANAVYQLKRQFGQQVDLYLQSSVSLNPSTGNVTAPETKHKMFKVPVLPVKDIREFKYDLSFIAANKNFTYGAFYDVSNTLLIIDMKDLPFGYVPNLNDRFVIGNKRYVIKDFEKAMQDQAIMYAVQLLRGQKANLILDLTDKIIVTEEVGES